jgi:hypothetical protein
MRRSEHARNRREKETDHRLPHPKASAMLRLPMTTEAIWLGMSPSPQSTRILAMRGPKETILKAHLSLRPSSTRAVVALLESLALWEGRQVRAALVADDTSCSPAISTTLYRDTFAIFGDDTPLYTLEWVPSSAARRRRDGLGGLGDFGDLERLLARTVAR